MALTLTTTPPPLIMAYAPVKFVAQTDVTETPIRIAGACGGNLGGDLVQPDSNHNAAFELSDYLQGVITLRGFSATTPQQYTDVPLAIGFTFVEWYGDPYINHTALNSSQFYLLDGYVPKSRRRVLYSQHSNLISYLLYTKACLTWWPVAEAKRILPTQKDFINYLQLHDANPITITLSATLLFTDGTTGPSGTLFTVAGVAYMKLIYFPTGYSDLGLAAIMANTYPTKTLAGYSVVVKTGSTAISAAYSYTLDTAYYRNPRTLLIRNAYGLWETVLCTGLGQQENEVKPDAAVTDGQVLPDKIAWRTDRTETVKVNTGFLTSLQMQWLADMDFREAYEVIGGIMHPVVFKDMALPLVHDDEYQYSAELEYEYAYYETIESAT